MLNACKNAKVLKNNTKASMDSNDSSVLQHTAGPVGQQSSIVYDAPGQPVQPALPVFQPGNCAAPHSQPPLSLCTLGVHTSTDVHDLTHGETADKAQTQCLGSLQYRLYYMYNVHIHTYNIHIINYVLRKLIANSNAITDKQSRQAASTVHNQ